MDPGLPAYTAPDETSGGTDTGSGTGTGSVVYIDPKIWNDATPTATCEPPCTLILPPWTLSSLTTIDFPVVTETIEETWETTSNNVVVYLTTTTVLYITIPPVTLSTIDVSNIVVSSSTSEVVAITSSIVPPPIVLVEPTHGVTYTYSPGPYPTVGPGPGPPPGLAGSLHITFGLPGPICSTGCGFPCLFNCGGGGGGGGDGEVSCIGPGCDPSSNDDDCVGDGCGSNEDENSSTSSTCSVETATDYWVTCSSTSCSSKTPVVHSTKHTELTIELATSSSVVSGCSITATATTTGSYCPT